MSDQELADRLAMLTKGDIADAKREFGLTESYIHRRCMAFFIKARDGVAGAAEAHALWLAIDQDFRAFQKIALARVCRIAEQFDDAAAALVSDGNGSSSLHDDPPLSAA